MELRHHRRAFVNQGKVSIKMLHSLAHSGLRHQLFTGPALSDKSGLDSCFQTHPTENSHNPTDFIASDRNCGRMCVD